jgi:hypothetical protein
MPYTRPWAEVFALSGGRDSDEIDDENRSTHTDLTERLSDILYDVEADPWVLKTPGVSVDGSQSHKISAVPMQSSTAAIVRGTVDVRPSASGGSFELLYPLGLPQGTTITNLGVSGFRTHSSASVIARLYQVNLDTGGLTILDVVPLALTQAGIQWAYGGVLAVLMSANNAYYIGVTAASDVSSADTARVAAVSVTTKLAGVP